MTRVIDTQTYPHLFHLISTIASLKSRNMKGGRGVSCLSLVPGWICAIPNINSSVFCSQLQKQSFSSQSNNNNNKFSFHLSLGFQNESKFNSLLILNQISFKMLLVSPDLCCPCCLSGRYIG